MPCNDSLLMLASAASGEYDSSFSVPDHHVFDNLHIPSNSPPCSPAPAKPLRRSSTSNTPHGSDQKPRFSGKLSKLKELPRSQTVAREDRIRRQRKIKVLIDQAQKIKSVGNSPVNPAQLRLLQSVFYNITKFPCDHWVAIIAVLIQRHFSQVKTWFSNQRQHARAEQIKNKLPADPIFSVTTSDGIAVKFREEAFNFAVEWSDDLFEGAVSLHYFQRS